MEFSDPMKPFMNSSLGTTVFDTPVVNYSSTMETRIYNGEKTVSSASGVGKTGQLYVNQ